MVKNTVPYDPADYLETPKDIIEYLSAALEDDEEYPGFFCADLGDVFRASRRMYPELQKVTTDEQELKRIIKEVVEETMCLNEEPWWKPIFQAWVLTMVGIFIFVGGFMGLLYLVKNF